LKPELINNRQFRFQVLHSEHCFPDGSLTIRDILKLGAKQNRVLSDQDNFLRRRIICIEGVLSGFVSGVIYQTQMTPGMLHSRISKVINM